VPLRRVVFLPPHDVSLYSISGLSRSFDQGSVNSFDIFRCFPTVIFIFQHIWRGDIIIRGYINIDHRNFIRAVRYKNNYNFDDLWYDTPEGRAIADIYNIEDIFNLRSLFGLEPYKQEPAPEKWD